MRRDCHVKDNAADQSINQSNNQTGLFCLLAQRHMTQMFELGLSDVFVPGVTAGTRLDFNISIASNRQTLWIYVWGGVW